MTSTTPRLKSSSETFSFSKIEKKNSSQHLRRRVPPRLRAHPGLAAAVGVLEVVRARDAAAVGPQLPGKQGGRKERDFFFRLLFQRLFFPDPSSLLSLSLSLSLSFLTPFSLFPPPTNNRSSPSRTRRSTWHTTASRTCSRAGTCTERRTLPRNRCAPRSSPTRCGTLSSAGPRSRPLPASPRTPRPGRPSGRRSASSSSGTPW